MTFVTIPFAPNNNVLYCQYSEWYSRTVKYIQEYHEWQKKCLEIMKKQEEIRKKRLFSAAFVTIISANRKTYKKKKILEDLYLNGNCLV